MENFLRALIVVLKSITPLKTALLISVIFSLVFAVMLWDTRQLLYSHLDGLVYKNTSAELVMSQKSKSALDNIVQNRPWIVSTSVISINVQLNKQADIYRYFNDKALEVLIRTTDAKDGMEFPLFSNNELLNKQVLSLLQGEFSCSKTVLNGSNSRYAPSITGKVVQDCRVPIPPAYGHLIGYISFSLSRDPTDDELDQLRTDAYTLSMSIYTEILKNSGPVPRIN